MERRNLVLKLFPFPKSSQSFNDYKRIRYDDLPYWYLYNHKLIVTNWRRNPYHRLHLQNISNYF